VPKVPLTTEETDALALRAVGKYPGFPLPHPGDCRCSEHPRPCPHDVWSNERPWAANPDDPTVWVTHRCLRCGTVLNPAVDNAGRDAGKLVVPPTPAQRRRQVKPTPARTRGTRR
jgi:hypothetical protein